MNQHRRKAGRARSPRSEGGRSRGADDARLGAYEELRRIAHSGGWVSRVARDLASGDVRRRVTDYVAGVTRWRRRLDFLIDAYVRSGSGLEPEVRLALQIGLYDLLMLDTPPHAAIHEAVELVSEVGRSRAGGLVNAVLRSIDRERESLPEPRSGDPADDLAVRHSHPTWLVRRWLDRFGASETVALLETNNRRPAYAVRPNTLRLSVDHAVQLLNEHGIVGRPGRFLGEALYVDSMQKVRDAGLLRDGSFAVQDEAAMLVVAFLAPRPGERLLDACAAPGGKALYAAERMGNEGELVAVDVHEGRLKLVSDAARRHGVTMIRTIGHDARRLSEVAPPGAFDAVLLDAPCTGTGVLSKRADLRWNRTQDQLTQLCALQSELLDAAVPLLKPGGRLVYATCSIEPEENRDQVERFLERHVSFQVEPAGGGLPPDVTNEHGMLELLPHRHGTDGAFAACLVRPGEPA